MADMPKPRLAIYVALAIAVLLIGSRFLRGSSGSSGGPGGAVATQSAASATSGGGAGGGGAGGGSTGARGSASSGAGAAGGAPDGTSAAGGGAGLEGQLVVDVKGAVRRPGVYRLASGARALDAVRHAGGMTGRADRLGVNLAARVTDGGEVVVPPRGPGSGAVRATAGGAAGAGGAGGGAAVPGGGAAGGAAGGRPISLDLNTATAAQLEQLDGVGPATAAKIVAYREQHGRIGSVDELDAVAGIGEKRLAAIRAQLEP